MPILWNTTEGDLFQKYTKEPLALCWKMSCPDASFMSDLPVYACCCDGPKLGADISANAQFMMVHVLTLINYLFFTHHMMC